MNNFQVVYSTENAKSLREAICSERFGHPSVNLSIKRDIA